MTSTFNSISGYRALLALVLVLAGIPVQAAEPTSEAAHRPVSLNSSVTQIAPGHPAPMRLGTSDASTFFSTVRVDERTTVPVIGNGDLWPSCWSDDGALYTASGDGWGMDAEMRVWEDLRVSRIDGTPPAPLDGKSLAKGGEIASVWSGPGYNRKPTGMVCVGGDIYLAVQDLSLDFEEAPAASIARSRDKGKSWTWDRSTPMFSKSVFTTVMFLDYGQGNVNSKDGLVYAYGIDGNWRFSTRARDPEQLYLGRVEPGRIQDRAAWEFFAGIDAAGEPIWSSDIEDRSPVLEDRIRIFIQMVVSHPAWPGPMPRIAQGGVFYNRPLNRYIYTSWTRFSWEFYEAPEPWGPWRHFFSKNFGVYPWSEAKHGGYAPTAPTKYVSADGRSFYVQANTFLGGVQRYGFALRKVDVEPRVPMEKVDAPHPSSLVHSSLEAVAISYSNHFGTPDILNDGLIAGQSEDSWNGESKEEDYWGYTWPQPNNLNWLEYATGHITPSGGWFDSQIRVQVRQHGKWLDVSSACSTPQYPGAGATANSTYVFAFEDTWGDGIRIIGRPGGEGRYTSIAELTPAFKEGQSRPCSP